jgi:MoaA/NifB/PqqE/SkfB family radical SAM enzyme
LDRQNNGLELSLENKLNILKNLEGNDVSIDFAGGDPLSCYENYLVIEAASKRFGKENISITSTGYFVKKYGVENLAKIIGEYEFTYDEIHNKTPCTRPKGYNSSNIKIAEKFSELGVRTKAQLPLHSGNIEQNNINFIYQELNEKKIDELLIMRTFPVGRGIKYLEKNSLNKKDICEAINGFMEAEKTGKTKIRLQCALKHLFDSKTNENPCDMMHESFGINFRGELLLSAWANNEKGLPLSDEFVLGSIFDMSFREISETKKFRELEKRMDENLGHCKIFSFMSSGKDRDSLFKKSDPLYSQV